MAKLYELKSIVQYALVILIVLIEATFLDLATRDKNGKLTRGAFIGTNPFPYLTIHPP